jgi:hypothetical protein
MRTADVISRTGNTEQIEANLKNTFQNETELFCIISQSKFLYKPIS